MFYPWDRNAYGLDIHHHMILNTWTRMTTNPSQSLHLRTKIIEFN